MEDLNKLTTELGKMEELAKQYNDLKNDDYNKTQLKTKFDEISVILDGISTSDSTKQSEVDNQKNIINNFKKVITRGALIIIEDFKKDILKLARPPLPASTSTSASGAVAATGLETNDIIIIKARWIPNDRIVSFDELTITIDNQEETYTIQPSKLEPKNGKRTFLDSVNDQKQPTISFGYDYSSKENKRGFFFNKLTHTDALVKIPKDIGELNGMIKQHQIVNFNQAKTISEALNKDKNNEIIKKAIDENIKKNDNTNIITNWPDKPDDFNKLFSNWNYVKANNSINYYAIILLYLSNSTDADLKKYIEEPVSTDNVKTAKNYDIKGIQFTTMFNRLRGIKIGGSKTKKYRRRITNSTRYRGNSRRRTASRYRANTTRR